MSNAVPIDINNPGAYHFSWTIGGGRPIQNYVTNQTKGELTQYTAPDTSSTNWYFTLPADNVEVRCVVTPPTGSAYTLTATVSVVGPTRSDDFSVMGYMQLLFGSNPNYAVWTGPTDPKPKQLLLWGAPNESGKTPPVWGGFQKDTVTAPSFLTTPGIWGYVQLYYRKDWEIGRGYSEESGLDESFPYVEWNTANSTQGPNYFYDAPGVEALPGKTFADDPLPYRYEVDGTHDLYIFYLPPNSSAGESIYVPIVDVKYHYKGYYSSNDNIIWYQGDTDSGWDGETSYPDFPKWGNQGS